MPIDPHNTADRTPHRNSILSELREMQRVAFARVMKQETEDKDVAQLLRAYVTAEQQRSILRMKPVPKPVDTLELERRRERAKARSSGPSEEGWRKRKREPKVVALPDPGAPATQVASEQTSPTKAN